MEGVSTAQAPRLTAEDVLTFEPNKEFLRHLLATQIDLTTLGAGYVRKQHERFQQMQEAIHGGEQPPSERVIDMHRDTFGEDYRSQACGIGWVEGNSVGGGEFGWSAGNAGVGG